MTKNSFVPEVTFKPGKRFCGRYIKMFTSKFTTKNKNRVTNNQKMWVQQSQHVSWKVWQWFKRDFLSGGCFLTLSKYSTDVQKVDPKYPIRKDQG